MDQKPKIPTLKDTQKPQVRIKGLAARLSLVERLKQFKKKDLAFILAGLGVLFMAPLAEHFMMSPENADTGAFKPGWGFQANRFGDGSSPYESGVNGMAPGGLAGGGGDVITPLNVRDPSSLVMGPGASQQPAATSVTPPAPAKENTDWKDAIANAAAKGGQAAMEKARLPVPKTSLTNAGLRGLGVAGGSSGAKWDAPPISAANVPNKAAGSNSLGSVTKAPGYMGVGSRGPKNADAKSLEELKKMAERAGSVASRQGSAATNLETAAGMGKGAGDGAGGAGQGMSAKDDKGGSGNSGKDSKSLGESLAFLAAKKHQDKAIELYWKMKEKDAMLWPNLKEKMLEEAVMTPFKALTKGVSGMFEDFGGDKNSYKYVCTDPRTGKKVDFPFVSSCPGDLKDVVGKKCISGGNIYQIKPGPAAGDPIGTDCSKESGNSGDTTANTETTPSNQKLDGTGNMGGVQKLDDVCSSLTNSAATDASFANIKDQMTKATGSLYVVRQAIWGTKATCGSVTPPASVSGLPDGTIKGAMMQSLIPILMRQPEQQAAGANYEPGAFTLDLAEMGKGVAALADLSVSEDPRKATASGKWEGKSAFPGKYAQAKEKLDMVGKALGELDDLMSTGVGSNLSLAGSATFPKGSDAVNHVNSLKSHYNEYSLILRDARTQYGQVKAALEGYEKTYPEDFNTLVKNCAAFVSDKKDSPAIGNLTVKVEGVEAKPTKVYSVGSWNEEKEAKKDVLIATRDFLVKQNGAPSGAPAGGQPSEPAGGLAKWVTEQGKYLANQAALCPPRQ
jgi:hypothetical protein